MTEPIKFWQRAAPDQAVSKHEDRHAAQVAKAKDRIAGRDAGRTAPRLDMVTRIRASGRNNAKGKASR